MLENLETGEPKVDKSYDPFVEAGFSRGQIFDLAKNDLNFFAALALPDVFTVFFPEIHLAVWRLLCEKIALDHDFSKLALGLPRGHAKTTLIKLFALYCILFTDRQFILIVCASDPRAQEFLADVKDMLDQPNIKAAFGDWRIALETDNANIKKFSFLGRNIVLACTGKGAVRGLNIKHLRPDVIVMDDMQTREDADSETQADRDLTFMFGTLLKLKNPRRCLYIFIGNMYHAQGCILRKLKVNKNWISFIVGAILSDGKPIWPELHSLESLMAEFENDASIGKPEIFFSEVMNDPDAGVSSVFDVNKIPQCPYVPGTSIRYGGFIIIDVATDKIGADDTTIDKYGVYEGGDIVTEEVEAGSFNPEDTIKTALRMALTGNCSVIAVESVAYQSSLLFWFHRLSEQLKIQGISFVEVFPRGRTKNSRILTWFKRIIPSKRQSGDGFDPPRHYLSEKVRNQIIFQISQFKPTRRDNKDDILDNNAYAEEVLANYEDFILLPALTPNDGFEGAKVVEDNSAF